MEVADLVTVSQARLGTTLQFHLEQIKIRAQIRIREGRAKPIDILALSMNLDYTDVEIALDEPVQIFKVRPSGPAVRFKASRK